MTGKALRATAAATLTATLLATAGCSDGSGQTESTGGTGSPQAAPQKLDWKTCPPPTTAQGGGETPSKEWQCATLKVPRDYADPGGEQIELALIRSPAKDKSKRLGSLVYNFGGPGGSGVTTLPGAAQDYAALNQRYDLVSFDPRGVGASEPVICESNQQLDKYYAQDSTPSTPAQEKDFVDGLQAYTKACEKNSGALLPYVGTTNAARDMDVLRQALGDEKLNYFGISYGTELGGVYAHLFPDKVGRTVFDAVVDPTQTAEQGALGQAKGFQLALDNFAQDCVDRGDACQLQGSTVKEIEDNIIKLQQRLEKEPIPGIGDRKLTQSAATNGIAQALYSKELWPLLEQGLDEAEGGQGQLLMALSDNLNGRDQQGNYSNILSANTAVNCADSKQRFDLAQTKAKLPQFKAASPVFGEFLGWALMSCTGWPVGGAWNTPDVSAPGAGPILVIGGTGDPATPYEGAQHMVERLGPGVGVEMTYQGEGHGAYNSGDPCVQKAVDGFLLNGTVPPAKTVCTAPSAPPETLPATPPASSAAG
ncbi:alpha/beta hydrolase [Streptomyces sp. NPDC089799]|uniref:alpha/beta hydrolase n=1 Tax=Streptomyces sp. NPDC089799 TaxID=3155066 RepID=UPI0034375344